ncbi:glycosyltransferase family 2 protein [Tsuneonella sp. HG249]
MNAVTISITRYAEPDSLILRSLARALSQEGVTGEVLFIDQGLGPPLDEQSLPGNRLSLRTIRRRLPGLSAARNLALNEAAHPLVLFLDADALADRRWAYELTEVLRQPQCAVAGSRIVPLWPSAPPFFALSGVLRDQLSLLDLGLQTIDYPRVVGAGFAIDLSKLPQVRFDETLGRRDGLLFGGEESDFCRRARAIGYSVAYVGTACVEHVIEPDRCSWNWILRRMIFAGHGRARLGGVPGPSRKAGFYDWLLAPVYLPPYAVGWMWGKLQSTRP